MPEIPYALNQSQVNISLMYSNYNKSLFSFFSNVVGLMRSRVVFRFLFVCLGFHISNLCGNAKLISLFCMHFYSTVEIILFQFGQIGYHRAEFPYQCTKA